MEENMEKSLNIIIEFDKAFRRAIANPDNYTKGQQGWPAIKVVNWDFIEADIWIDLSELFFTNEKIRDVLDEEMPFAAQDYLGNTFKEANS